MIQIRSITLNPPMTPNTIPEILECQWKGYTQYHASKLNLIIHIVCVPLFVWGNVAFLASLFKGQFMGMVAALIVMGAAFSLQGIGHKAETTRAVPFSSASNAFKRILLEQWVTFPKFVISGGWWKALNAA
jgi:hypothetical protein